MLTNISLALGLVLSVVGDPGATIELLGTDSSPEAAARAGQTGARQATAREKESGHAPVEPSANEPSRHGDAQGAVKSREELALQAASIDAGSDLALARGVMRELAARAARLPRSGAGAEPQDPTREWALAQLEALLARTGSSSVGRAARIELARALTCTQLEHEPRGTGARADVESLLARRRRALGLLREVSSLGSDDRLAAEAAGTAWRLEHSAPGCRLPALVGRDVDGNEVRTEDLMGRVVLLHYWDPEDPQAGARLERDRRLVERFWDDRFVLIGIAAGLDEGSLRRLVEERELDWAQVRIERRGELDRAPESGPLPEPAASFELLLPFGLQDWTVVLDRAGRVRAAPGPEAALTSHLMELLAEPDDQPLDAAGRPLGREGGAGEPDPDRPGEARLQGQRSAPRRQPHQGDSQAP